MTADVTVLTPSIPGRESLLAEACASVWAQTEPPSAHLIRVERPHGDDLTPTHIARQRNILLAAVATEWVATLDDDDLWHQDHIAKAAPFFDEFDVVYSWPMPDWAVHRVDVTDWDQLTLRARLRYSNLIPSAAFIRTEKLRSVAGWSTGPFSNGKYEETGATWEDWDLWIRLADAGARFACTGAVTWYYRLDGTHEHTQVGR